MEERRASLSSFWKVKLALSKSTKGISEVEASVSSAGHEGLISCLVLGTLLFFKPNFAVPDCPDPRVWTLQLTQHKLFWDLSKSGLSLILHRRVLRTLLPLLLLGILRSLISPGPHLIHLLLSQKSCPLWHLPSYSIFLLHLAATQTWSSVPFSCFPQASPYKQSWRREFCWRSWDIGKERRSPHKFPKIGSKTCHRSLLLSHVDLASSFPQHTFSLFLRFFLVSLVEGRRCWGWKLSLPCPSVAAFVICAEWFSFLLLMPTNPGNSPRATLSCKKFVHWDVLLNVVHSIRARVYSLLSITSLFFFDKSWSLLKYCILFWR